jgi:hypothetical protein
VACGRGLVLAASSAVFLLCLAHATASSPALGGIAAVVIVLEFLVFGGIGAGASWWFSRKAGRVVAWSAASLLLLGNVMAVVALLPAVRADERVLVAVNIQRDDSGRMLSWECLPEFRALTEVYHTERIVWMAASNPLVLFGLLGGEADSEEDVLSWLPGELQNAAGGSQVPCLEGQERDGSGVELPLATVGIALQMSLGGAILAGGHLAVQRRARSVE